MKENNKSKTIIVFASSKSDGNTGQLVKWIADDLNIEVIDLTTKNITPYDYDNTNSRDDFLKVMKYLLDFDKLIFASPIYWYSMCAQMKIFFDRISDLLSVEELKDFGRALRGKTAYIICTSVQKEADDSFIDIFTKTFDYLGMNYGGFVHADCNDGFIADNYTHDVSIFTNKFNVGLIL